MGEVMITAKNFDANMRKLSHEKMADTLCKTLKTELKEGKVAIVYLSGCTYYLKPIKDGIMGFGSGRLEIIFNQNDDEETIKSKLMQYFDKSYSDIVGYSGYVKGKEALERTQKYCEWNSKDISGKAIGYFDTIYKKKDIQDIESYGIWGKDLSNTKIFYIIGKSAAGKDTVLKGVKDLIPELKPMITYTTRPIRDGEKNGEEYNFINQKKFEKMKAEKKFLECRKYDTVKGKWLYATAKVEKDGAYIGIGTLKSYMKLKEYYRSQIVPIYVYLDDNERLKRAFKREEQQLFPNYKELCRRAMADEKDYSEENIGKAGIVRRFCNDDLQQCIDNICVYIMLRMPKKRRRK